MNPDDLGALRGPASTALVKERPPPSVHTEIRGLHRDGSDVWMSLNVSLARDWQFHTHNLIVQAQDVSARRRAEAELYHNAYHDSLTQLSNRTHFNEQLNRAIARVQRHPEQRFAVMYLDFDRFKVVNDSLGHKAGDELLVNVARRLKGMLRESDVLARLGGDEFAILAEDLGRQRDAVELAERIHKELQRPVQLGHMEVAISASIGITYSTNDYQTSDEIIRDADIAMYKAKSKGKAQYALFDSSQHAHVSAQLALESELRKALGKGQIYLEYQPICTLKDGRLMGFEALARWNHPTRGLLEPSMFIPVAEETGLIVPLGNWVLTEACRQMREWKAIRDGTALNMSVNVSSLQLTHPDFVSHVQRSLQAAEMSPGQLTLEVTESVLMDGIENAISTLSALRHMGVTLSIDDFGTGYSSLSYLATLPIDALKVDRSFIDKMSRDGEGSEIVKAIFKLGQALSKEVYAEGIETRAQLTHLLSGSSAASTARASSFRARWTPRAPPASSTATSWTACRRSPDDPPGRPRAALPALGRRGARHALARSGVSIARPSSARTAEAISSRSCASVVALAIGALTRGTTQVLGLRSSSLRGSPVRILPSELEPERRDHGIAFPCTTLGAGTPGRRSRCTRAGNGPRPRQRHGRIWGWIRATDRACGRRHRDRIRRREDLGGHRDRRIAGRSASQGAHDLHRMGRPGARARGCSPRRQDHVHHIMGGRLGRLRQPERHQLSDGLDHRAPAQPTPAGAIRCLHRPPIRARGQRRPSAPGSCASVVALAISASNARHQPCERHLRGTARTAWATSSSAARMRMPRASMYFFTPAPRGLCAKSASVRYLPVRKPLASP